MNLPRSMLNFTDTVATDEAATLYPFITRSAAAGAWVETESRRPEVRGKFLTVGNQKLFVRGVTYGTFKASRDGNHYPGKSTIQQDFAQIRAHGFNAIRT